MKMSELLSLYMYSSSGQLDSEIRMYYLSCTCYGWVADASREN